MSEETETLDLTTDEALLSSLAEHELEEFKLEPFSLLRQAIAIDLCGSSKGGFFSAVMTVWICTLSPKQALREYEDFEQARIKAFEWAEGRGYSLQNYKPLLDAYRRLNEELSASASVRIKSDSDNGDTDPNVGGQPT